MLGLEQKLSLYGFNNLTKTLSFNIYDVCYAKTEREQKEYIAYIDEQYNSERLTKILCDVTEMIGARILNISKQDYEPQGASVNVLIAEKALDEDSIDPSCNQGKIGGDVPEMIHAHLDKSHVTVHTFPEYHPDNSISTFRVDIDVSTCGTISPLNALNYLISSFDSDIITIDYRVRGFTRDVLGKKFFIDHKITSIQDYIDKNTLTKYDAIDVNVYQSNIFHTKLLIKDIDLQNYLFKQDVIIALGGGSAMDAGKIMWVMYEHPEVDFLDMAMRFMDIRKRVYTFPKMGEKAYFVAIPTSSGTGSEVTPFAVITDDRTGTKYPLADYELLPNMAIVDADNMMNQPRGLTSASGIDVLTHGLEAYASMMATDYTDGLALKSMKNVFDYLPRAYEYGAADPEARQKMADASCMAGMAFANAFLGVCHSMAHKLGAYHHLPHGVANALMICHVLRYNAAEVPTKMGTFPQYDHPHTLARYAECARFCGICGKDDEETLDLFIQKIEELKTKVGIKKSIAEYGISEEAFMSTLDQMVEDAFDDQCTGANPRYPLLKEIKAMYLKAYYGEKA